MLNQFYNLSCYEEFEIQYALTGVSKVDALKRIGYKIDNYYFFISNDGIFNWFDLNGNHVKDPVILKELTEEYIPCSISKCVIPNSVISIDNDAFSFCKLLTSIIIPDSIISIGNNAFSCCYSLKEITIPDSVTSIGNGAFYNCESLTSITIPNGITSIGVFTFLGCKSLEKIVIPNGVTSIRYNAFYNCNSLKEVIFKGKTLDEVKRMENYPFRIEDKSIIKCEI